MSKILIKGFYGFGNFGDDILMITAHKIIREIFPHAKIFIGSESKEPNYIFKFLRHVEIVNSSENLEVDWTIHGGGGVFFDFTKHSAKYFLINRIIKIIGYDTYKKLFWAYQTLKGHGFLKQRARAGLGVGVGTYTLSSNRFLSDILALSTFDILLVRDDDSVINAKQYNRSQSIYKSSDLAFLFTYWMPTHLKRPDRRDSIGFILRDWIFDDSVAALLMVAKELRFTGHDIKFFALDERADTNFVQEAAKIAPVHCWKPDEMTIEDYLSELVKCKLVISSRAHGAIVSACLGIPVCCILIEPKLRQVAQMLKNSAQTVEAPFNKEEVLKVVKNALQVLPSLREATSQDVERNNKEMSHGISLFRNFVVERQNGVR